MIIFKLKEIRTIKMAKGGRDPKVISFCIGEEGSPGGFCINPIMRAEFIIFAIKLEITWQQEVLAKSERYNKTLVVSSVILLHKVIHLYPTGLQEQLIKSGFEIFWEL